MSIATITEPSIGTSTATDRLTEALGQKLSHPATSPDFDLHAETNDVLKDIGLKRSDAIAATFFFIIYLLFGAYIFRNRHRFFDRDPNVDNDIPAVRKIRIEVVMIPWLVVTTLILILLTSFWLA
jgi:hypothetical protein